ncbi:MAG TPA: DNA polymerase IV [Acidimicrobiia bacterium]|nr:DNA polymerase IV [Acidimicrobiia bacterium]
MTGFAERIAHVDMDAFFVEVERLRRPELRNRATLVGGTGPRSVVASASYEARERGVTSAMPMARALRLCPHAVVVPPDHLEYRAKSAEVFEVLASFTPWVESVSVDEAFLDIAGLRRHHDSPDAVAIAIRAALRERLELPASVGLATTKLLAKLASRDAKPDGFLRVPAGGELAYLHAKPVRALWGVGEATHARLEELGVETIGDIAAFPRATMVRRLGDALGGQLWDLASGIDERAVEPVASARSISVEETYAQDLVTGAALERETLALADRLASRLHSAGVVASTVHVKVRYPDFTTVTRSHTFDQPVSTGHDIYRAALSLLDRTAARVRPVRLLGIGAEGLAGSADPRQLSLQGRSWEDIEGAVEEARARFGRSAVERARLVEGRREGRERPGAE